VHSSLFRFIGNQDFLDFKFLFFYVRTVFDAESFLILGEWQGFAEHGHEFLIVDFVEDRIIAANSVEFVERGPHLNFGIYDHTFVFAVFFCRMCNLRERQGPLYEHERGYASVP